MEKQSITLRPAWAEINLQTLEENFRKVIARAESATGGKTKFAAVVKADGYGHGLVEVSRTLIRYGAEALAVATVPEGIRLRQSGIGAPIMVLGLSPEEYIEPALDADLILPISSEKQARALADVAGRRAIQLRRKGSSPTPAPFFLAVDTGMGRIGVPILKEPGQIRETEAFREACRILRMEGIHCKGVFTHLADADGNTKADKKYTQKQWEAFRCFVDSLKEEGLNPGLLSVANSAALLFTPDYSVGVARPGIVLYGYLPCGKPRNEEEASINLTPVMTVKAKLIFVKTVPSGTAIGYGSTFVTKRETIVGTVPVGYADGYPRAASGKAEVLIHGKRVPVIGRICMDQFMVDLTDIGGAQEGEEVILLGSQGGCSITADDIAEWADTISYEILCGLGQRLERLYL